MTDKALHNGSDPAEERRPLRLAGHEYLWPLFFLLSMSMMGLRFPLGYLLVPIILISTFRRDRYDFLIMLTLFFGGFGLIGEGTMPVKPWDIAFVVSIIGLVIMRKDALMKKTLVLTIGYAAALVFIATFSEERMAVQLRTLRNYLFFIYFIVPMMVFAGRRFDMLVFFRRLIPYVIILCCFYIFDGFIASGHFLLPCTHISFEGGLSVFYDPVYYGFGFFPRIYPPGLFIAVLAMYPFARIYKPAPWQWVVMLLSLGATRTFTVISGLIATYAVSMPDLKRTFRYASVGVGVIAILCFVDMMIGYESENGDSALRIYSSVQQITDVGEAQDDEDIAELGSGRIGQAIPKFELVSEMNKEAVGLGFLHAELTTNTRYIIDNPFYTDISRSEEVATGIEVEPLQVYLSIGYIGLSVHFLFLFMTYYFVRKYGYSFYYLTVLFGLFWFGLGGFAGLNAPDGLLLCSLAFSIVVLDNKNRIKSLEKEENQ